MTELPSEFVNLVRTMPWIEAEEALRDRKLDILDRLRDGKAEDAISLGYLLSAINDEIHIVSQKQQRASWSAAVRAVHGEEGWARVREYMHEVQRDT